MKRLPAVRAIRAVWWLLLIPAAYLALSLPEIERRLSEVALYHASAPEQQMDLRTLGRAALLRDVFAQVPETEAILLDVPQKMAPLWADQLLNYWLYPRRVYSAHALRLGGEDVGAFVRAKEIRWAVRGERLLYLGGSANRPTPSKRLPSSVRIEQPLRAAAGMAGALAHFFAVGLLLLWRTRIATQLTSRAEHAALAFLIGVGAVGGWVLLLSATEVGASVGTVLLSLPLAILPGALRRAPGPPEIVAALRSGTARTLVDRVAIAAAVGLLGLLIFRAVAVPMNFSDSRYQWAHKAHVMLAEQSIWGPGFQDPRTLHFHPKYPLLIPSAECVFFLYAGGFNDQFATPLFPALVASFAVILFAALGVLRGGAGAGVALLSFALLPYLWGYDFATDGGAGFTGYPDLAVAMFVAAAMVYLIRSQRPGNAALALASAVLVLFAVLSKAEGKVHLAAFLGLLGLLWLRAPRSREVLTAIAAFGAVALLALGYELWVVAATQPGYLPDDDYSKLLSWTRFAENADRLPAVWGSLSSTLFASPRFGWVGALIAGALALRIRRLACSECWLPLLYIAVVLLAFSVPYTVLAEDMWERIFAWSAGRLVFQLTPLAFLALFLIVLPAGSPAADETVRAGSG